MQMKKIYGLAALAVALGSSFTSQAAVTTMDQLAGKFEFCYMDGPYEEQKSTEAIAGESPNEILFTNFYYIQNGNLPATVDFEKKTVTFKSIKDWVYMENYKGMADIQLYMYNSTHTRKSEVDELTATIEFNGNIQFDDKAVIEIRVPNGVNPNPGGGMGGDFPDFPQTLADDDAEEGTLQIIATFESTEDYPIYFKAVAREWVYEASDWEYGGLAEFTDMWLAPKIGLNLIGGESLTYDVEYLVNVYDPNRFLLVNPYGKNTIWGDASKVGSEYCNTSDKTGYIYINADVDNFVQVERGVFSGYSSNAIADLACTNEEGYRLWDGSTIATIKSLLNSWGIYSFSSKEGNVLNITNLIDSYATNPYDYAPEYYVSKIVLKPGEKFPEQPGEDKTPNAMPSGVETAVYSVRVTSASGQDNWNVNVAITNDKIYIQGLCNRLPEGVVIADYNEATGSAVIAQNQYIGIFNGGDLGKFEVYTRMWVYDFTTGNIEYADPSQGYQLGVDLEEGVISYTPDMAFAYLVFDLPEYGSSLDYLSGVTLTAVADEGGDDDKDIVTMPEGVESLEYTIRATFEHDLTHNSFVNVAIDDDYIYIQGLCYYLPDAVIRCNYDKSAGRAYLPQGELVGYWEGKPVYTRLYEYDFTTYNIVPMAEDAEYIFMVSEDGASIYCPNGQNSPERYWYIAFYVPDGVTMSPFAFNCLELVANISMEKYVDRSGTPANPFALEFDDTFNEFSFMIPNYTTENVDMNTNTLYYQIWVNGEPVWFEGPGYDPDTYEPLDGQYPGTYGTYLLPYYLNNGEDILSSGMGHAITIYEDNIETLSVQSVYTYSDAYVEQETTYSEIVTLNVLTGEVTTGDLPTGIDSILSGSVVSTEYYTIGGQKVNNPDKGIYIMRSTLSNGRTVVKKVVK